MNRPESPSNVPKDAVSAPTWCVLFYRLYWPAWWIGTALIVASWLRFVSPKIGWIGFAIAGIATLGSYVIPSFVKLEDFVVLDSWLLKSKDDAYRNVMQRFLNGASMMYDGVVFGFRPDNEIACGIVAKSSDLDDLSARETADHGESVFAELKSKSPEFDSAVSDRTLRVSIMSSFDGKAVEICRVVKGELQWHR